MTAEFAGAGQKKRLLNARSLPGSTRETMGILSAMEEAKASGKGIIR